VETTPKYPQRVEDLKAKKLMERIEKMRVLQGKNIGKESSQAPVPQQCPSAA